MRPTSRELIDGIAAALRTRIAPLVADQPWPASYLRSIDTLLAHLAERVEHEHSVLVEDNADLRALLAVLAGAEVTAITTSDALDVHAPSAESATTTALHTTNLAYREVLERAIHELHTDGRGEVLDEVRIYLRRAAERDRRVYGAFVGRPTF